jgi:hypothetical protein
MSAPRFAGLHGVNYQTLEQKNPSYRSNHNHAPSAGVFGL